MFEASPLLWSHSCFYVVYIQAIFLESQGFFLWFRHLGEGALKGNLRRSVLPRLSRILTLFKIKIVHFAARFHFATNEPGQKVLGQLPFFTLRNKNILGRWKWPNVHRLSPSFTLFWRRCGKPNPVQGRIPQFLGSPPPPVFPGDISTKVL